MSTIDRRNISTETVFEQRNGYSRIVRVGPHAWSAGTLAIDENGDIVHSNSHYQQTLFALEKIETALNEAGVKREHIVRTRLYVTQANHHEDYGQAHADFFGEIMPACTMVEVKGLVNPFALVEVELEAYVPE